MENKQPTLKELGLTQEPCINKCKPVKTEDLKKILNKDFKIK